MTTFATYGGTEHDLIAAEDRARDIVSLADASGRIPGIVHVVEVNGPDWTQHEEGPSEEIHVVDDEGHDALVVSDHWQHVAILHTVGWTAEDLEGEQS